MKARECVAYSVTERAVTSTGWCAVFGNRRPDESMDSVPTLCGMFVILPGGFKKRRPTCSVCIGKLERRGL